MERWHYGVNNYYKTASICRETAIWPIFAIERGTEFVCDLIPPIPLPNIKIRLEKEEAIDFGSEFLTIKEWYGDSRHLFHALIHIPIFNFCYRHIKTKMIDVNYEKLKELFYEDNKDFWDE